MSNVRTARLNSEGEKNTVKKTLITACCHLMSGWCWQNRGRRFTTSSAAAVRRCGLLLVVSITVLAFILLQVSITVLAEPTAPAAANSEEGEHVINDARDEKAHLPLKIPPVVTSSDSEHRRKRRWSKNSATPEELPTANGSSTSSSPHSSNVAPPVEEVEEDVPNRTAVEARRAMLMSGRQRDRKAMKTVEAEWRQKICHALLEISRSNSSSAARGGGVEGNTTTANNNKKKISTEDRLMVDVVLPLSPQQRRHQRLQMLLQ